MVATAPKRTVEMADLIIYSILGISFVLFAAILVSYFIGVYESYKTERLKTIHGGMDAVKA